MNPFAQIIQKKQQELKNQPVQQNQPFFSQNSTASVQGFLQQQQTNQIQTSGSFLFTDQAQQKPTNLFASIASPQQPTNPFTKLATSASPSIFNTQSGKNTTEYLLKIIVSLFKTKFVRLYFYTKYWRTF